VYKYREVKIILQSIDIQICGLIPLLLLCFFSFWRQSVFLRSRWIYRQLLLITTLCVAVDIISISAILYAPHWLTVIVCKLYLWLALWTGYISYYYLAYNTSSIHAQVRLRKIVSLINVALSLLIIPLPISFVNDGGKIYSKGPAVTYTFALAFIYVVGCITLSVVMRSQINPHRSSAIRLWMFFIGVSAVIQFTHREILVVGYAMMLGVVVLYARLENPDAFLDRSTGAYSFEMFKEYAKDVYEHNENVSLIVIAENDRQENDSITSEMIMLEMASYLKSISGNKVFRGFGNDFIMAFPDAHKADLIIPDLRKRFRSAWAKSFIISPDIFVIPETSIAANEDELIALYQYYSSFAARSSLQVSVIGNNAMLEMKRYRDIQREIRSALEENRIDVFFQPIYSIREQKFVSAEALVRMYDRDGRIIMPSEFIPVAEQSGLITLIGDRVFENVCRYIRDDSFQELGIRYVEINLSVVQCENSYLAERYAELIQQYEIPPSSINLEITESGRMRQKNVLVNNMTHLRDFGCSFSLDDFGTGESNLDYIVDMPVDIVKFDRTIILSYFSNERTRIMMDHITRMIKSMGMSIVAEGVEEHYQFEALKELGIDFIQGYYFSKPIPEDEFVKFIKHNNSAK
jgi:EAL domain-containing protein (putative c-di-GMP-specific phosphodiesterase class I)